MKLPMWRHLKQRLEIQAPIGEPQEKPNVASLVAFENRFGLRLLESYRSFVRTFGAGEIGAYFNIFAPGYPDMRSGSLDDFIRFIRNDRVQPAFIDTYKDAAFIRRMVPFADTIGGDVVVWDPYDLRDRRLNEYGIYVLPDDTSNVVEVAATFSAFIESVCLSEEFAKIAGPTWSVVPCFAPFGRRKTQ